VRDHQTIAPVGVRGDSERNLIYGDDGAGERAPGGAVPDDADDGSLGGERAGGGEER
jgi:hypothetical protein